MIVMLFVKAVVVLTATSVYHVSIRGICIKDLVHRVVRVDIMLITIISVLNVFPNVIIVVTRWDK